MSARAQRRPRRGERERGMALIVSLIVMVAVVAICLSLARSTGVELSVAGARLDELKLRHLVASAVERAIAEVRRDSDAGDTLFATWRDNEAELKAFELEDGIAWLSFGEPDPGDGRELRYGLRDEASKLDVNTATREQLLALPGITDEAVDGILDWRDADEDALDQGAENGYYLALVPPYRAKNGPIESLDELLRIKGIDEAMLYGEDRNRNGLLDPGEDDGDRSFPPDDADGQLDRGLADYLTVYSRDLNRTRDGRARLNFNSSEANAIASRLEAAGADAGLVERVRFVKQSTSSVSSLGELVFRVGSTEAEQVAHLLDELTNNDQPVVPGKVNVNTCPREVLQGLQGLTEDDVSGILTRRLDPQTDLSSPAWLLHVVPIDRFAQVVDLVTTRSDQFTVHAVAALRDRPQRFRRVQAVIDRNFSPVRILLWRDITALGFPLPNERGEGHP